MLEAIGCCLPVRDLGVLRMLSRRLFETFKPSHEALLFRDDIAQVNTPAQAIAIFERTKGFRRDQQPELLHLLAGRFPRLQMHEWIPLTQRVRELVHAMPANYVNKDLTRTLQVLGTFERAMNVTTMEEFGALIEATYGIRDSGQRAAILRMLGYRIGTLEAEHQADAIDIFVAASNLGSHSPLKLTRLRAALINVRGDASVAILDATIKAAVHAGENVQAVLRWSDAAAMPAIVEVMEEEATVRGPAGEAVRDGRSINDVAALYGITTVPGKSFLADYAAHQA